MFLHGLGSDREGEKAQRLREHLSGRGPGFLALDFTGHGASGGDCHGLSLTRNLEDIGRAVSFVREEAPGAPLILVGSSMGGIAALWYAALAPAAVFRVFAIAPALSMAARFAASLSAAARRDWENRGFLPVSIGDRDLEIGWGMVTDEAGYPTDRLAADLRTRSLLIHGDEDAVVPPELSRDLAEDCAAADLIEIEGGDHRLGEHRDLLFEIMWTAFSSGAVPAV
jgi:pimeloyl-ACP methyl ester carboxylesterase